MKLSHSVKESNSGSWNKRTTLNGKSLKNTNDLQSLNKDTVTKYWQNLECRALFLLPFFYKSSIKERQLKAIKRLVQCRAEMKFAFMAKLGFAI